LSNEFAFVRKLQKTSVVFLCSPHTHVARYKYICPHLNEYGLSGYTVRWLNKQVL